MLIAHVVGARPQFIKLAPVAAAVRAAGHDGLTIHTGQHFDDVMSRIFFAELGIGEPQVNLGVHSLSHGAMTGRMLEGVERVLLERRPAAVLVYGDTDSTLAGAVAAVKLGVPCAHVEAGLRSSNRTMPEEHNRVAVDHLADLLLAPTETAMKHLQREGLAERARLVGDVMYDALRMFGGRAEPAKTLERLGLADGAFFVATIHRAATTGDPDTLQGILATLDEVSRTRLPVVLPLHPRTRKIAEHYGISTGAIRVIAPVSYVEMLGLLQTCRAVLTDSGGLQKDAYFARKVCFTLRQETEWTETVEARANVVCGTSRDVLLKQIARLDQIEGDARFGCEFYGRGDAAQRIVTSLADMLARAA